LQPTENSAFLDDFLNTHTRFWQIFGHLLIGIFFTFRFLLEFLQYFLLHGIYEIQTYTRKTVDFSAFCARFYSVRVCGALQCLRIAGTFEAKDGKHPGGISEASERKTITLSLGYTATA
jgi:hypothetical protein